MSAAFLYQGGVPSTPLVMAWAVSVDLPVLKLDLRAAGDSA
jgi:hypothetical protein